MANKFLKECFLQNIYHYEALEVWEKLKIGQVLSLDKDEDKKVVIVYEDEQNKRIGSLSDDDAKFICDIIEAGYTGDNSVFLGIVSFKSNETADENKRLKVIIKIKESEAGMTKSENYSTK